MDIHRPRLRHSPGDRWFVDETYVKINGVWRYVYRAVDQYGQVVDVLVSARRDAQVARRFFQRALSTLKVTPSEVVTDAAVRRELLDRVLIFGRRHLQSVVVEYVDHYNAHRPHRSLGQAPPLGPTPPPAAVAGSRVMRRDRLGGLIGEYSQAA
jgi:transposase-like protein